MATRYFPMKLGDQWYVCFFRNIAGVGGLAPMQVVDAPRVTEAAAIRAAGFLQETESGASDE